MSHILRNGRGKHYSALWFGFHNEGGGGGEGLHGLLLSARKPHMTLYLSVCTAPRASMSKEGTKPKLGQSIKQTHS